MAQRKEGDINQAFGTILRRFRADLGMSQRRMALFLGVSQSVYGLIELGGRPIQAAEIWSWSEKIATRHPMKVQEIRREFFEGPFLISWVARESNPEPTDSVVVPLKSITYPHQGGNSPRKGEFLPSFRRVA